LGNTMRLTIKILLIIVVVLMSFPTQIISGSYTYRETPAIVDETVKKTSNYRLKKKLIRLEEALEIELDHQLVLRFGGPKNESGFSRGLAQHPPTADGLVSVHTPSARPANG